MSCTSTPTGGPAWSDRWRPPCSRRSAPTPATCWSSCPAPPRSGARSGRWATSAADIDVRPLYGALSGAEQDAAIEPSPPGRRKVVLATSIAETSLTIEGVTVVVDAGWRRTPRLDPGSGMSRLVTLPVTRAEAEQRTGRAGRLGPGVAYRLWSRAEQATLRDHPEPEIEVSDLDAAGPRPGRLGRRRGRAGLPDPAAGGAPCRRPGPAATPRRTRRRRPRHRPRPGDGRAGHAPAPGPPAAAGRRARARRAGGRPGRRPPRARALAPVAHRRGRPVAGVAVTGRPRPGRGGAGTGRQPPVSASWSAPAGGPAMPTTTPSACCWRSATPIGSAGPAPVSAASSCW